MKKALGIRNEFELYDESFHFLILGNAWVERLHSGTLWANGNVDVFRYPANCSNGNTRDRQGRLVSCEHFARRVTRTEVDGKITEIVSKFDGKRLNSPNDVV